MFRGLIGALCVAVVAAWSACAVGAESLVYSPPQAWVKPLDIPTAPRPPSGAIQVLLLDHQSRYGPDGDELYQDYAMRALNPQGLSELGTIVHGWDPATETFTIHKVEIIRGDQVINALAADSPLGGEPFLVLRRETNLSMATLDGALTATKELQGLQVGDIVRVATTRKRFDPIWGGKTEDWDYLGHPGSAARVRYRMLWPASKPIRWRVTEGFGETELTRTAEGSELVMDRRDVETPIPPEGAPLRFNDLGEVEVSEFADWRAISRHMAPLYTRASALNANSPLKAQAQAISAANSSKSAQMLAALKLVQDQVRYVALVMGAGGYTPAQADQTWARRFGDCKGKTALLIALLSELGIKAEAVAVNAFGADGLDQRLPRIALFNHVVVRAELDGKTYWLDGTRRGDEVLADLAPPAFDFGLPLSAVGSDLVKLVVEMPPEPMIERLYEIDLREVGSSPKVRFEIVVRGDEAKLGRLAEAGYSAADLEQLRRNAVGQIYPALKISKVSGKDDGPGGAYRTIAEGTIDLDWGRDTESGLQAIELDSAFEYGDVEPRTRGLQRQAPIGLNFPNYERWVVRYVLPRNGDGFTVTRGAGSLRAGGLEVVRTITREGDFAQVEVVRKSTAREIPIADAIAADARFSASPLGQRVLLRAPASFRATAAELNRAVSAGGAQALVDRGARAYDERRYNDAITDFTAAITADPTIARSWRARANAKLALNDLPGALADAEEGLRRDTESEFGFYYRALVKNRMQDREGALKDLGDALTRNETSIDVLLLRIQVLSNLRRFEEAQADIDRAIRLQPDNVNIRLAASDLAIRRLTERPGEVVQLADRQAALAKAFEGVSSYQGLIQKAALTMRGADEGRTTLADLGRAVGMEPERPDAYFVRGRLYYLLNRKAEGDRDLAKAVELNPSADGYVQRASIRFTQRDYPGAAADYQAALAKEATNTPARLGLARVQAAGGENDAALASLEILQRQQPSLPDPMREKATIYRQQKNYAAEARELEALWRLTPADLTTTLRLVSAYELDKNFPAALGVLDRALASRPDQAMLLNNRCYMKAEHKLQLETAMADCDAALNNQPRNAAYLDSRGFLHLRLGDYRKAIDDFTAALAIEPIMPTSSYGRGVARQRLGDRTGATADLAEAKRADPAIEQDYIDYGLAP